MICKRRIRERIRTGSARADPYRARSLKAAPSASGCRGRKPIDRPRGRRLKTRAALFHAVGRPLEVVEIDLDEPRPARGRRPHGRGRDLRHRPPPGEGRVPPPDADGARPRGRGRRGGGRRRRDARATGRRGRALLGSVVRRVRRLPSRPTRDLQGAQRGDPERHAAGRDDRDVVPGRDRVPRHGDRLPRRACRRLGAGGAPARGRRPVRPGRAARLCRAHRRRRGALRGARRAGLVGARDRRRRRRPVRRPGSPDRRCGDDRRLRPGRRASRGGAQGGGDARRGTGRAPRT